jgi:hypothetical protein
MGAEVISLITLAVTVITYLDELTWAREHAVLLNAWLLAKLAPRNAYRYRHNACRNHRVQGKGRII